MGQNFLVECEREKTLITITFVPDHLGRSEVPLQRHEELIRAWAAAYADIELKSITTATTTKQILVTTHNNADMYRMKNLLEELYKVYLRNVIYPLTVHHN